jgi:hypothetical protein
LSDYPAVSFDSIVEEVDDFAVPDEQPVGVGTLSLYHWQSLWRSMATAPYSTNLSQPQSPALEALETHPGARASCESPVHVERLPLPDTTKAFITVLKNPQSGGVVYLIRTAHISKASRDDVRMLIETVKPDAVAVEVSCNAGNLMRKPRLKCDCPLKLRNGLEIQMKDGKIFGSSRAVRDRTQPKRLSFRRGHSPALVLPGSADRMIDRTKHLPLQKFLD